MPAWQLALSLAAVLVAMQLALWAAARALGARLPRRVIAAGLLLPCLLLAPWISERVVLAPTISLAGQIPGTVHLEPNNPYRQLSDAVTQFLPWELEVRRAFKAGRLPLWSDALGGGSSPWVNPQAGALSPIAWLARPFPLQHFFLLTLALKILVAFEGTWLLARRLGGSRLAAWVAALSFALGGGILGWALFPHTATAAFIPWVALGAVGLIRRPRPAALVATALATAALLVSGHPETALAGGLLAAGLALGYRRRRRPLLGSLVAPALAAGLGLGLAAPLVVPFLFATSVSQRASEGPEVVAAFAEPPKPGPWSWSFAERGRFLLAPTSPNALGRAYGERFDGALSWPDSTAGYAGLVAFAGALLAAGFARRRAAPALGLALSCYVLAAQPRLLLAVLFLLPPFQLPAYSRFLLPGTLALALAGGMGVAALAGRLRPRLGRAAAWALPALVAVVLVDLVPWGRNLLPRGATHLFYPPSEALAHLGQELAGGGPWRVVGEEYLLYPELLNVYQLEDIRPHNPLAPRAQIEVLDAAFGFGPSMAAYIVPVERLEQPFLDFLNVRAVLSNRYHAPLARYERFDEGRHHDYRLWRNPHALPRWFFPTGVDALASRQALPAWIARLDDARRVAVDAGQVAELGAFEASGGPDPVSIEHRPGFTRLRLSPTAGGARHLLATSLPEPDGWQATANGQELPELTVNGAFFATLVPANASEIELRYRPRGFWLGWGVGGLSTALLVLSLRRRAAPHPRNQARIAR